MSGQKFGANHARGMFYVGLAEISNSLVTDSSVSQRHFENGVWGMNDRSPSSLDRHVEAANAEAGRVQDRSLDRETPQQPREMDRD